MGERVQQSRSGPTQVWRWRRSQLLALGFTANDVTALTRADVDLGEVRRLIAAGCPRDVLLRILL